VDAVHTDADERAEPRRPPGTGSDCAGPQALLAARREAGAALANACAAASAHGIRIAMGAVALLLLWGSLHYLLAARALRADLDTVYRPAGPEA